MGTQETAEQGRGAGTEAGGAGGAEAGLWTLGAMYLPVGERESVARQDDLFLPASRGMGYVPDSRAVGGGDWRAIIARYSDWSVDVMLRIVGCESHGDQNAMSPDGRNWGAYQLNLVHGWSIEQMTDPATSTELAHDLWLSSGYGAWSCY